MTTDNHLAAYRDEFGGVGPLPANVGQRIPPEEGFFTGPVVGSPFPEFTHRSSTGETINPQRHRGKAKAAANHDITFPMLSDKGSRIIRSPIKGFNYIRQSVTALMRGPAGKRASKPETNEC